MNAVEERQRYYRNLDVRARIREFLGTAGDGELSCEFVTGSDDGASPPFERHAQQRSIHFWTADSKSAVRFGTVTRWSRISILSSFCQSTPSTRCMFRAGAVTTLSGELNKVPRSSKNYRRSDALY